MRSKLIKHTFNTTPPTHPLISRRRVCDHGQLPKPIDHAFSQHRSVFALLIAIEMNGHDQIFLAFRPGLLCNHWWELGELRMTRVISDIDATTSRVEIEKLYIVRIPHKQTLNR